MKELTILIPVHKLESDTDKEYLNNALKSLSEQSNKDFDVVLYMHKDVKYRMPSKLDISVEKVKIDEQFSYQSAVNDMVNNYVKTEYFCILEFDDIFHPYYVQEFYNHYTHYDQDYDIYMGMIAEVNAENQFMGLRNEAAWIVNNMNELGVLDLENTKKEGKFQSFSLTGSIFNRGSFLEIGGLKEKFPIFFNFEYILRALHNGHEIYVIPKVMVNHTNGRTGSYFDLCAQDYKMFERKEYLNFVTKEYVFEQDRELVMPNADNNLKPVI